MNWDLTIDDESIMKAYILACSAKSDNSQCKSKQRSFRVQLLLWLAPAIQPSPCQAADKQQGRSNSRRGNKKCYCRMWCARNSEAHASHRANNKLGCVFKCSSRFLVAPPSCPLDSNFVRPSVLHTLCPTERTAEVTVRWWCGPALPVAFHHGVCLSTVYLSPDLLPCYRALAGEVQTITLSCVIEDML